MHDQPAIFEEHAIRRVYDAATETWWFSVVDIIQVLTQQVDYQTARKYWNKLKQRLSKEGNESVTDCHRLKLPAADGKNYLTDVAIPQRLCPHCVHNWIARIGNSRCARNQCSINSPPSRQRRLLTNLNKQTQ
jgi:hypothetical protein